MAKFGGWLVPLQYDGGQVVAEPTAVRTSVGLFDVSHWGKAGIRGAGAVDFAASTGSSPAAPNTRWP